LYRVNKLARQHRVHPFILGEELGGQVMANDQTEDGAVEKSAAGRKPSFKLIAATLGVFVLLSCGASYYLFFMRQKSEGGQAEAMATQKPQVFVDVPELLVNLANLPGERVQYLKVKIVLEVKDQPVALQIQPAMPRVLDIFQTYMRELRASDLNGSVAMFRLKEELTRRVNAVIQPSQISAVLFKEIVVQ
jgi:flagellar protein FliL